MGFESGIDPKPVNGRDHQYVGRMGYSVKQPKVKPAECGICGEDITSHFVLLRLKDKEGNPAQAHVYCEEKSRIFLRPSVINND